MNTRQHLFLAAIVLLMGCLVLLIVGVIQQNPPQANSLSSALSAPPATPVTAITRERAIQVVQAVALQGMRLTAVSTPTLISADLMSYPDAYQRIWQHTGAFGCDYNPPGSMAWLVVMTGTWQIIGGLQSGVGPPSTFSSFFLASARDGTVTALGGYPDSPPKPMALSTPPSSLCTPRPRASIPAAAATVAATVGSR